MDATDFEDIQAQLSTLRCEEAEALRRALHLRQTGTFAEHRAAMTEADRLRAAVNALQRRLRQAQLQEVSA